MESGDDLHNAGPLDTRGPKPKNEAAPRRSRFRAAAAEKGGLLWRQTKTDHFTSLLLSSATPQGKFRTWKRREVVSTLASFFIQEPACLD